MKNSNKETMTKEESLKKIEELKKYVAQEEAKPQGYVIKNRYTGEDIFVSKYTNVKDAVLEALDSGADLSRAYLSEADLSGAYLRGANLSGAELQDARFYGRGGTSKLKKNQVADFLSALGFQVEE